MQRMQVVVGVIKNDKDCFLITRRSLNASHSAGLWEFPGGKLDIGESLDEALDRELYEELGITVHSKERLLSLEHDYSSRSVALHFFQVLSYAGLPEARETQLALRWVSLEQLSAFEFPEANQVMIRHLQKRVLSLAEKKQN